MDELRKLAEEWDARADDSRAAGNYDAAVAIEDCADELRAALAAIPEGWVLVPVEPTDEMIEAICAGHTSYKWPDDYDARAQKIRRGHACKGYAAMLNASPPLAASRADTA